MRKLDVYQHVAKQVGVEIKENFGFPFTSVNGNMFSFLSKEDVLGIRLPLPEREDFIQEFESKIYQRPQGQTLKEYVVIPDQLLDKSEVLVHWFKKSQVYAQGLKPKKKK